MARPWDIRSLALLLVLAPAAWHASAFRSSREQVNAASKLRADAESRDGAAASARNTPVTRVVDLLKAMQTTLSKDMEEDEALYDKLKCWCQSGKTEKEASTSASEAKIGELLTSVDALSAKGSELTVNIKELESELASNKEALSEATVLREKQQKEYHGFEVDSTQAIENLKAAIAVLSKHQAAPESSVAGGPVFKTPEDSFESFIALKSVTSSDDSWTREHEASHAAQPLEDFMRMSGFDDSVPVAEAAVPPPLPPPASGATSGLLQDELRAPAGAAQSSPTVPPEETAVVQRALRSAAAFMQARQGDGYYPAYNAQSDQILGYLTQLKRDMLSDLVEARRREQDRAAAFSELLSAKSDEIMGGEKMAEQKEDDLATSTNKLAEAKLNLRDEEAALTETQKLLANQQATCTDADKNFQERKSARMEELKAVTDAIEVLAQDEARDAMSRTYSLLQQSSSARHRAASALRSAARRARDQQLSVLASAVELDSFAKVKVAIEKMVGMLKVQQEDEVKKSDFCKAEIHSNEMDTEKKQDEKGELDVKDEQLASDIKVMEAEIADGQAQVTQLQLDLQQASKDRQAENLAYRKTIEDQALTVQALRKALARLQAYYKKEDEKAAALLERGSSAGEASTGRQTPPVPQMSYEASKASTGVMQLIEKLIQDANTMTADARKSEVQAQAAYEQTVKDTNAAVIALQKEVSTKAIAKGKAAREKLQLESDIASMVSELDGLAKYNSQLHAECDYLLKNFQTRQEARADEIEALQQAMQILRGATLS